MASLTQFAAVSIGVASIRGVSSILALKSCGVVCCLVIAAVASACEVVRPPPIDPNGDARFTTPASCETLFGRPSRKTGLSPEQCMPSCDCGGVTFEAPLYLEADIEALRTWRLVNPFEPLDEDPYGNADAYPYRSDHYCAVRPVPPLCRRIDEPRYELRTYETEEAALSDGAKVTHRGACGTCSSLSNLAAYIEFPDLTDPVRECGLTGFGDFGLAQIACIASLGFDLPCAQIWSYNTNHTRGSCGQACIAELSSSHNEPDGRLNPCLYCDEVRSGEIFKSVAGRTRRASGLPSAICRPCSENGRAAVYPVEHYYTPHEGELCEDDEGALVPRGTP